jgi:hypothetical protein
VPVLVAVVGLVVVQRLVPPDRREAQNNVAGFIYAVLEAVMNSIRNGLGMRKTENRKGPSWPENPHPNAVFTQVHNTL